MGCDIHLALERRLINKEKIFYQYGYNEDKHKYETIPEDEEWQNNMMEYNSKWNPCSIFGEVVHGERIYEMFANLAGVRGGFRDDYPDPKGLPDDVNKHILEGYTVCINDELAKKYDDGKISDYTISEQQADEWNKKYNCKKIPFTSWNNSIVYRIECPDWHSVSWATTKEFETAFNKTFKRTYNRKKVCIGGYSYYQGILNLMKCFEENGDYEVRMVYWFDN